MKLKTALSALAGVVSIACASQASAADMRFYMTGTITSGSGGDGSLAVGSIITLAFTAPADAVVSPFDFSSPGTTFVYNDLSITGGDYHWVGHDDEYDGTNGSPVIISAGGKITSLYAPDLAPAIGTRPDLITLGGPNFEIESLNLYLNTAPPTAFFGTWDLANSVALIPEPSSWAMMLLGAFGAGAALRRRRAIPA